MCVARREGKAGRAGPLIASIGESSPQIDRNRNVDHAAIRQDTVVLGLLVGNESLGRCAREIGLASFSLTFGRFDPGAASPSPNKSTFHSIRLFCDHSLERLV